MSANEISNALSAGGVAVCSATPGTNAILPGSYGLNSATRVSAGVYRYGLANKIAVTPSLIEGFPVVTQLSGTSCFLRASILPVGDANEGDLLVEAFSRAAGTAADLEGNISINVIRCPVR